MVVLKTRRELALMRDACRISAEALQIAGEAVKPGVTTAEIDRIAYSYIRGRRPISCIFTASPPPPAYP